MYDLIWIFLTLHCLSPKTHVLDVLYFHNPPIQDFFYFHNPLKYSMSSNQLLFFGGGEGVVFKKRELPKLLSYACQKSI